MPDKIRIIDRGERYFSLEVNMYRGRRWLGMTFWGRNGSLHYLPLDYYNNDPKEDPCWDC